VAHLERPLKADRHLAAVGLFFAGLERVGPPSASILSTFEPAVAMALAAILLGVAMTVPKVACGFFILAAVATAARSGVSGERFGKRKALAGP
jgi:drug/metabolite transporter (DMT)-like permease